MQEKVKTHFFQSERVKGFGIAVMVTAVLSTAGVLSSNAVGMVGASIVMAFGSLFTISVLIGLVTERYRKYAQGALIAWVLYTVAAVISSIYFT